MNWKLFDVRYGRANRLQFFLYLAIMLALDFLISKVGISSNAWVVKFFVVLYFVLLLTARRVRDTGFTGWFATIAAVPPAFTTIATLSLFLFPSEIAATINVTLMAAAVPAILFVIPVFLILLIAPGSIGPNKYGYPPVGLNFASMISDGSDGRWKKAAAKADAPHTKQDRRMNQINNQTRKSERDGIKDSLDDL